MTDSNSNATTLKRAMQTCQVQSTMGEMFVWEINDKNNNVQQVKKKMQTMSGLISSNQGGGIQHKLNAVKIKNSLLISNSKKTIDSIERERDRGETIKKVCKKYNKQSNWLEALKKGLIE